MERTTTIIKSFLPKEINLGVYQVPIITVYKQPKDFPENYVARLFNLQQPTKYAMVEKSLEAIREGIPNRFHRLDRFENDDPNIVEIYL
jgi:hypothetical protein